MKSCKNEIKIFFFLKDRVKTELGVHLSDYVRNSVFLKSFDHSVGYIKREPYNGLLGCTGAS